MRLTGGAATIEKADGGVSHLPADLGRAARRRGRLCARGLTS